MTNMEAEILKEIKEVRQLLAKMIGTFDLPAKQQFSIQALDKAAEEFKILSIQHGEWISDISKIIKGAPYGSGKFIVEKFGFNNYFIRGKTRYFNRKDLMELNNELKGRNINLARYIELIEDQEKFQKYIESAKEGKKKGKHFQVPEGLKDIQTSSCLPPRLETIQNHIDALKSDFENFKLVEYIDLYEDSTYAMFKYEYYFDRYLEATKKKQCRKWCEDFNYANHALKKAMEFKNE
jgi:hypothetical protein